MPLKNSNHPKSSFNKKIMKRQDKVFNRIAQFAGDMRFVYYHALFFAIWIIINIIIPDAWDPYPFIFLTLVVSLEAIFLATFVLINQNKDARRSEHRERLDLQVDQRAEVEIHDIKKQLSEIKSILEEKQR